MPDQNRAPEVVVTVSGRSSMESESIGRAIAVLLRYGDARLDGDGFGVVELALPEVFQKPFGGSTGDEKAVVVVVE